MEPLPTRAKTGDPELMAAIDLGPWKKWTNIYNTVTFKIYKRATADLKEVEGRK